MRSPVISPSLSSATFTIGGTSSATQAGDYTATATACGTFIGSDNALSWNSAKAPATVILGNLATTFDSTPKTVTATTSPVGKSATITYAGSSTAPTLPGNYAVVATVTDPNYAGSTSGTLVITDNGPVVTAHSSSRNVLAPGDDLTLSVTVAATGTPTYQWYHDGRAINGATGGTYSINDATYAAAGAYWVTITNAAGSARSAPFFVLVAPMVTQARVWGGSFYGVNMEPPAGMNDLVAISACGNDFVLALRRNGTVTGWGSNLNGRLSIPANLTPMSSRSRAAGTLPWR